MYSSKIRKVKSRFKNGHYYTKITAYAHIGQLDK